jgi:REP element-mobilizing transposase RayT
MRKNRVFQADTWYEVSTKVNRQEPIFLSQSAQELFEQTLHETKRLFEFELRELIIEPDGVTFLIKPAANHNLSVVMRRLKQTFAVRYNAANGRTGHIWGDRWAMKAVSAPPVPSFAD